MNALVRLVYIASGAIAAAAIYSCGGSDGEAWFAPPRISDLGAAPVEMSWAEFNGDKQLDLLFRTSDSVFIALGTGDGTLQRPTAVVVQASPRYAASGDLNADSVLDLVVIDCSSGDCLNSASLVTIFGNGDGTFRAAAIGASLSDVVGMAVGDLNGDGCADVVVGRSNRVASALLGKCDGTFREPIDWGIGPFGFAVSAAGLKIADMDIDGKADLVAAWSLSSMLPGGIYVQRGMGDGSPGEAIGLAVGIDTSRFVIADFDRDGIPDLEAAGIRFRGPYPPTIWLGNGDGSFGAGKTVPCSSDQPTFSCGRVYGFFDGDDIVDVAEIPYIDGSYIELWVALGKGDGTFQDPRNTGLEQQVDERLDQAVDVNGDGATDLVFATPRGIAVWLNNR